MYKKIYQNMCLLSVIILALTLLMVLSACYAQFNSRLKTELRSETEITAAALNGTDDPASLLKAGEGVDTQKRISIIGSDGTVLYDNHANTADMDNHNDRPEVIQARETGNGSSERTSVTQGTIVCYYAIRLDNGSILRIASPTNNLFKLFAGILLPILILAFFIYFLSTAIAVRLTDNITRPINELDLDRDQTLDEVYDELLPFVRRISEQNKEIKSRIAQIQEQQVQLQAISDAMTEGLIVLNQKGDILSVNPGALKIFDAHADQVLAKNFVYLCREPELNHLVKQVLEGKGGSRVFVYSNTTYELYGSPVIQDTRSNGAILLVFDISERSRMEQMRREFTANVSHELKTPLTTILGYSQLIHNGMVKGKDIPDFAGRIEQEATRLITLIEDIIKQSKLDECCVSSDPEPVDLRAVCKEVLANLSEAMEQKHITSTFSGTEHTTILADPTMVEEMVYNLVDNAVKYNTDGGTIALTVDVMDGRPRISVSDTGIGIPDEEQERIFERFYRVDKSHSRRIGGTGLGLSIVKHIALALSADISVNSCVGQGTTMTVTF